MNLLLIRPFSINQLGHLWANLCIINVALIMSFGIIFIPYHFPSNFCKNVQVFVKVIGIVVVVDAVVEVEERSRDVTCSLGI